MKSLMDKLGIKESQVITKTTPKAKGKETTDSDELKQVRKLMNNTYLQHCSLVNGATYFEPIYERDDKNRILLDKDGNKVVKGYRQKSLTGSFILEDNKDGTPTASKLNVYKESYQVDSNSLNIAQVTKS